MTDPKTTHYLLTTTTDELPAHLDKEDARAVIRLARSRRPSDVDTLLEIAMTWGLRHPRIAIDAVTAQQAAAIARRLLWTSALAAIAAVASAIAAFVQL